MFIFLLQRLIWKQSNTICTTAKNYKDIQESSSFVCKGCVQLKMFFPPKDVTMGLFSIVHLRRIHPKVCRTFRERLSQSICALYAEGNRFQPWHLQAEEKTLLWKPSLCQSPQQVPTFRHLNPVLQDKMLKRRTTSAHCEQDGTQKPWHLHSEEPTSCHLD